MLHVRSLLFPSVLLFLVCVNFVEVAGALLLCLFLKLTLSYLHLNTNRLIFCNPGNVKGYLINPFMARSPDDHSFYL